LQRNITKLSCIAFTLILLLGVKNVLAQTANFTVSIPSKQGCSPLSINFTDVSTGGTVSTRTWDLGNTVVIPNGPVTVGANYITPGKYYITLTVLFTNGITRVKLDSITVHPKPVADFRTADSIGCAAHTANFISLSSTATGTITNYQWDFGAGGITGTNPTPSFTYSSAGLYQVSLIVRNSWGCTSNAETKPQYIKVFSPPTAFFNVNPYYSCENSFTAVFTNASTGGDPTRNTYEWNFGDGSPLETTPNASHTFTGDTNYIVTFKVRLGNNCVSSYQRTIYVGKPKPTITVFPTMDVCVNTPINFVGTGTANTSYLRWYFPDNNQTQYYGNVTHTFTNTGTFELLLISINAVGCADTVRRNITVKSGPIIDFTPDIPNAACIPHTVSFTNNTIGNDLKFAWNYGDGSPVDTINGNGNAVHQYTAFGTYTVTVYAKDTSTTDGCFAYKTFNYIRIYRPTVTLNVIPPNGCLPLPVAMTATVSNPSGTPVLSYDWDFGDGSPVSNTLVPNNFHIYATAGSFPATVTINMQGGCSYTSLIRTVTVRALCDDDGSGGGGGGGGGFMIGKTCANKYEILFTDTIPNTIVTSWDFGDGTPLVTTGILNPISHTFIGPQKIFIVTVVRLDTITNIVSSSQKRVIIIDEKANFIPNLFDICKDKNVLFNTIDIDSSLIRTYTWDYGDGTPRFLINNASYFSIYGTYLNGNTNHTYTTNGVFYVKLIIEDKLGCKDSLEYPVPISVAGPIARFTGGPLTSCTSPLITNFTSNSVQNGATPITEWQWTFGDASPILTTTVDSLIPHTYTGGTPASFYTVKLKIKDAIGCEADTTRISYVKIYKPKADFFSFNTLQCNNYTVLFYGYTSQAINPIYQWYFGDGTVSPPSTLYYVYHTYPFDSSYNIKLVITDENGCKDSLTKLAYINIVKPKADFKINDTLQCAPASITFADSSKYASSYLWDFGDGSGPSTSPNPAPHIYGTPGFYNVKLTITGPNGCTDVKIKQIRVRGPIGNLSVGANQGCRPYTLPLSITGGNFISTYAWDFGDGTPVIASPTGASVNHVYNFAGKYLPNIVLTSPEGCPFTLKVVDTIFVDSLRAKFTTPINTFCQTSTNQNVNFTNLTTLPAFSNLLNSTWHFGDGTTLSSTAATVSHTYTGYGTFYPYLATKSKYGCIDTFRLAQPTVINAKPIPSITGANVYCLKPLSILSYNGSTVSPNPIVKYIWKIDADSVANTQNLNINYRTPGTHVLKYIVFTNFGCVDSITKTIIIDSVVTKFTNLPTQFCGPKSVVFTNLSTNFAAIQNFIWTYGDNTPINTTVLSPTHLYAYTGSYNVKLFMQTINGCKDSITKTAAVVNDSIPKAVINGAAVFCLKPASRVQFASTITTLNPIVKYRWYIDNALVGSLNNLDIDYRTAGTHTISLYIETNKGCSDSVFKSFIVDSVLTKYVNTPTQWCGPKLVTFTNQSTQFAATQSFYWNFGDGSPIETSNVNPQHLYAYTGTYNVKLFMQTINGCKDSITKNATVVIDSIPKPTINGAGVFCLKPASRVQFTSSVVTLNPITSYKWFIDNIQVATTQDLDIDYRTPGNHIVKLYVETSKGCNDFITKNFIVDSIVTKYVNSPTQWCGPKLVTFTNQSTQFAATQSFYWNFGDNSPIETTNVNPQHLYAYTGTYNVKLFMQTINGCKDSITKNATVVIDSIPKPTINGAGVFCLKPASRVQFTSSVVTLNPITTYKWHIDNIQVATTQDLDIDYRTPGNHIVKLYVETGKGCNDFITKNFIVDSIVTKYVNTPTQWCGPKLVTFTNQSTQFAATQSFYWNFGDGSPIETTNLNPQHLYAYTGSYNVKLYMQTINGCKDSITKNATVIIDSIPKPTINGADVFCLKPLSRVQFTSSVVTLNPITSYKWFIDNIQVATTQDLDIDYRIPGNHIVKLYVETSKGCNDFITKNFIVDSIVTKYVNTPTQWCGPKLVTFTNQTTQFAATQNFYWNFGDNSPLEAINVNPQHLYAYTGSYNVKLFMQTINGCKDSITKNATVIIDSIPKPTINGAGVFCLKPASRVQFTSSVVTLNPITSYKWYIDNIQVATTQDLDIDYRTPGNHMVKLYVETGKGCNDFVTKNFIVDSVVTKYMNTPTQWCGPKLVTFANQTTQFAATQSFYWNFGDGSPIETTNLNPQHLYAYTGSYNVKLYMQTINGCKDSITKNATVVIDSIPKPAINGAAVFCLKPASRVQFTSSVVTLNPITSYKWFIDNIQVATTQDLDIDYRTPGNHIVKLYVETGKGCNDFITKNFIVDSIVTKYVNSPTQWCGPKLVTFTNQTTNFAAIQNYTWTYGDGVVENNTTLSSTHLYNLTGSYNVKLYMQTINDCKDSITKNATVVIDSIPKPTINGAAVFCLKPASRVQFTSSVVTLNPIVSYKWFIDNIQVASTQDLDIDYRTSGNHVVKLYVETGKGCNDFITKNFIVDSIVTKYVNTPTQWCGPKLVTFTNQTTNYAPIQSYVWTYGDNTPNGTTVLNPTHLYAYTGTYNVKLYMETINGCFDDTTITAAVRIDSIPTAKITGNALECSPDNYSYSSATSISQNSITTYQWKVNGNIVAATPNLNYNFNAGTHTIYLKIKASTGCEKDTTKIIKIDSLVSTFNIPAPIKCGVPSTIAFNNTAYAQFGITNYLWNFGNSSTLNNSLPNPTSTYNAAGVFPISLKIISATGCDKISTQISNVTIYAKPIVTINGLASACANTSLKFIGNAGGTGDQVISKEWKVNGVIAGTGDTLNYLFTTANTYTVTFNVKTQYGCDVTETKTVIINPLPIPNATPQVASICLGSSIILSAQSGTSYNWTSPISTSGIINPGSPSTSVLPTTLGDIKYYVLVTNQFGCKKTDSVLIKVQQPVNLTYSPPITICERANTQLVANGNTNTFKWSPSAGLNDSTLRNPIATPAQNTNYRVVGYSNNVCKNDTGFVLVTIQPTPTVNAGADVNAIGGSTVQLNATASNSVTNYTWTPSNRLSCTNCPNPQFINVDKTTTFKVNVFTQYGCTNSDEVTVFVLCGKGAIYIPNAFTPNGDGKNDRFSVLGYGVGKVKSFTVFNRYGEVVFQRKDYTPIQNDKLNSWDGKVKGQDVQSTTTFVYIAEVTCDGGESFTLKNTVILVK
jgi:gliding motility-associated-like protein